MAELSDEEAQSLGLEPKRELSDDEAIALGLEKPKPAETRSESGGVQRLELHKVAPDTSDAEPAKLDDEGLLAAFGKLLAPKASTGAFAHGTTKGGTLGFADEAYGAMAGQQDTTDQLAKVASDVDEAKRRTEEADKASQRGDDQLARAMRQGSYDPSAAIDPIPQVKFQLKREGQPTETVVRPALSPRDAETPVVDEMKNYRANRDAMREDFRTAEKAHPVAFGAGELVGSVAAPIPGPGKAKGLAKIGGYGLQGLGVGLASGAGNSEADLTKGELGHAALDTGKSGLVGAGTGLLLGYGASKLDPYLEKLAARRAYKAMDPYMATIAEGLGPGVARGEVPVSEMYQEIERIGRKALDEGIIPEGPIERFAGNETINARAFDKLNETGQLLGATVDHSADELEKLGQANPVSLGQLATRIEQEAAQAKIAGNQDLARKLMKEARDIRQTIVDRASAGFADPAAQTLQKAEEFKRTLQGKVDYGAPLARREAQTIAARLAKEQAENAIEQGLGPDQLEEFKALKNRYGDLATMAKTSGHGAIREFRNQSGGLGSKLAASVGASAGAGTPAAIPLAIASGAAHQVANHRGSAAMARTLTNMAGSSRALNPLAQWESLLAEHQRHQPPDDEEPK